ncbi:hypothetical protein [Adlercreutzia sp. ZJ242]|uniref:hypothetical protein n=1 Tax=Adlercreutzia sp. ZJ242 TaxID=2709409 RepID=UPI0013EAAC7B|nr:hypothetical protein [Adlercreutzia sp. ZJ242]
MSDGENDTNSLITMLRKGRLFEEVDEREKQAETRGFFSGSARKTRQMRAKGGAEKKSTFSAFVMTGCFWKAARIGA